MWNTSPSGWTGTAGHVWLLQSSPVWPPECTLEWQACLHWTSRRGFLPWRRQWKSHNWWTGLGTASRQTAQLPVSKGGGAGTVRERPLTVSSTGKASLRQILRTYRAAHIGQWHDDLGIMIPNHPPEVLYGSRQGILGHNEFIAPVIALKIFN